MPIDFGGAGALLIRRDVLEAIGDNWFRYSRQTPPPYEYTISEDMHFYAAAKRVGFQPYVDWDCECGHFATMEIDGAWNMPYVEAAETKERELAAAAKKHEARPRRAGGTWSPPGSHPVSRGAADQHAFSSTRPRRASSSRSGSPRSAWCTCSSRRAC
jgi:hypothetical protein